MKTESPGGHNRYAVTGRLLLAGELVAGALIVEGGYIVEVRIGEGGTGGDRGAGRGAVRRGLCGARAVRRASRAPPRAGPVARGGRRRGATGVASLGRTGATFAQRIAGLGRGATLGTHLSGTMS